MTTTEDELIGIEREGWDALSTGRGGVYYRERLTQNAVMAFPFGVLTRAVTIEAMESAPPWSTYQIEDPRVVSLTEDSGVLVYRVTAQRAGEDVYSAVVSSTYLRQDGSWKVAFHQQSPE